MRKIDYMNDPLDFCLYPNEIVQRFAGREVFAYGTGYECLGFFQLFARFLKIKQVVNHFDASDFAIRGERHVADIDALLSIRKGEPIFVLSHGFWVEIVDYLESKGLVLGKDVWFWEQGWPMDETVTAFIKHNERLWKSEKIESKNRVLIPFEEGGHWLDAGRNVVHAYCANYLAKVYNAEIDCYLRHTGIQRRFMYNNKTARNVVRSFNATRIFDVVCNQQQLEKAKQLFNQILSTINSWRELSALTINEINIGNDIIRDYMRFFVPTVELKTPQFVQHLWYLIQRIVFLMDYFQTHNDIKAIVLADGVCREGFIRDIAVSKGIPTYAVGYIGPTTTKLEMYYPSNEYYKYYKEFFHQLSPQEQIIGIEFAKRSLAARLQGDNKDIPYMKTSIYSMKLGERVTEENDKIKCVICPTTLEDDIHCGWQVFGCFMSWLIHLGELSNRTNYDWYLKIHPIGKERDDELYKGFLIHYPRIKLIPKWTSPKQLKAEGVKFAFTIYGTLGHEYPALGIQVINAGNNPHIAFNFCYNPRTPEEFDKIVYDLPSLVDKPIDMQEIYQFYCIRYLYYKLRYLSIENLFFKRPELFNDAWIPSEQRHLTTAELIVRYKYYLDDWTPELHEITKRNTEALFREMDSYRDDVFYKNDPEFIKKKLAEVGLSLD